MRAALLAAGLYTVLASTSFALPPSPPADFEQPQSAPRPAPFPVTLVDQGRFDPNLKGYYLPEGFRLEIVASDPDVVNPVGLTFGPDGSLFVLEWRKDPLSNTATEVKEVVRYRDGSTRQVATMRKFVTDVVKQLKYDPATGTFGSPKPVVADELPSSVLFHDGWLYVTGRGTVRRYKQSTPGGKWDVREVIAHGFCGFHHHQVSGLTIGNDGWLYLTSGDDDNVAEGSDGSRATALRTGAVFRCRPDGSKLEVFSVGYRNPYRDVAQDERFNLFHADNDNEDGSRFMGCRLVHVAEGADYGWRLGEGARCCRPDLVRAAVAGELPGRLPPMLKTGRGAPAGLLIYNDTRIPEAYRGLLFYPDAFRKLVRAYAVTPEGSSFKVAGEFEFLKSDDPLFRPCQMVTGPDGAIYVCDWRTDSGGAGKLWGDGVHGRVYRIRWAGTPESPALPLRDLDSWAKIGKRTDAELVETLGADDFTDRVEARKELVRRGARARDLVLKAFRDDTLADDARLPAMGVLQAGWDADVEAVFRQALADESADVRRLACEGLGRNAAPGDGAVHEALLKSLGDHNAAVRRAAALAVGRVGNGGAADALVNALKFEEGRDPFLHDAHVRGLERLGRQGVDALLSLAQSGDAGNLHLAVVSFAALRTRPAAEALPELLANPHLSPDQREALVRSYANYQLDPPVGFDPLAQFFANRPDEPVEVVQAAVEVFGTTSGTAGPATRRLLTQWLSRPEPDIRLAVVRAAEVTRLNEAAPKLFEMVADEKRPLPERLALLKAVRVMDDPSVAGAVGKLVAEPGPTTLRVQALRTLAVVAPADGRAAAEKLLEGIDAELLAEAVAVLGAKADGAKLVGERFLTGKLPRDLFPRVTDALHRFADDPALARLRADVMKGGLLLSMEPAEVRKLVQLVRTQGDAKKGRELFLNTKVLGCAGCHRLEGVGGQVGPDLTRVWDTQTVEKLLESIITPSKEIKEGYQTYRVVTAKGLTLTGLRLSDTAKEVVIRDASGRDVHVRKDDVEEAGPTKTSLMPEDAVAQLTRDQFVDLLAFLQNRGEQEGLRGTVAAFAVGQAGAADLSPPPPEVFADATGKAGGPWHVHPAGPDGTADLRDAFPSTAGGVFVRVAVFAPKRQTAVATLAAEVPARVWVNGKVANDLSPDKPGLKRAKFEVELQDGWNVVLMKLVGGGPTPSRRLGLQLVGDGLRTAPGPETAARP